MTLVRKEDDKDIGSIHSKRSLLRGNKLWREDYCSTICSLLYFRCSTGKMHPAPTTHLEINASMYRSSLIDTVTIILYIVPQTGVDYMKVTFTVSLKLFVDHVYSTLACGLSVPYLKLELRCAFCCSFLTEFCSLMVLCLICL